MPIQSMQIPIRQVRASGYIRGPDLPIGGSSYGRIVVDHDGFRYRRSAFDRAIIHVRFFPTEFTHDVAIPVIVNGSKRWFFSIKMRSGPYSASISTCGGRADTWVATLEQAGFTVERKFTVGMRLGILGLFIGLLAGGAVPLGMINYARTH